MRSAEAILIDEFNKEEWKMADIPMASHREAVLSAIREAQREIIRECAEVAKTEKTGNSGSWYDASVDKQSILQLLNNIQ